MDPIHIAVVIRALFGLPKVIDEIRSIPSKKERERAAGEAYKFRQERKAAEAFRTAHSLQVSEHANRAYANGMKLWKGSVLRKPDRKKAVEQICIAARGGHLDAQMMARIHAIKY